MGNSNTPTIWRRILISYVVFSCIIFAWEMIVYLGDMSPTVLVPPSEIYPIIFEDADILLAELWFTAVEVLLGWFFGNAVAIAVASVLYRFKRISQFFVSLGVIVNAIPLIALAAILGGIVGTGQFGKSFIVALLVFFPMLISTLVGLTTIDCNKQQLLKSYGANEWQIFKKLRLPSALPGIWNTLKINVVTSIFAAVVGEFFGAHGGIGNLILAEKGLYDLSMVWAAIFYIIVAGSFFYFLVTVCGYFSQNNDVAQEYLRRISFRVQKN